MRPVAVRHDLPRSIIDCREKERLTKTSRSMNMELHRATHADEERRLAARRRLCNRPTSCNRSKVIQFKILSYIWQIGL